MKLLHFLFFFVLKFSVFVHANDGQMQSHNFAKTNTMVKAEEPILTKSTEVAALGRVADLGDLYDARSDNFVEISLYTTDLSGDAIHSTDNAYSSIDYVRTESISEKMEKLGVQASLSVSFLGGLVSASGSGKYLGEDKKSAKSAKTSLIYSVRTVRDDLKIFSKTSRSLIDTFLLENIDATHVVVGIDWGANVVLSLEETNSDSSNAKEIQGKLEAALDLVVVSVSGSAEVDFGSSDVEKSSSFSLHLNGDIIPNTVPQTINESISFIRDIPNLIKNENDGKGKILNYILMPLQTVQKVFQAESNKTGIVKEIDQELIDQFMRIFQEMKDSELQINDAYDSFNTWNLMVPENEFKEISEMKSEFDSFTNDLRVRFADLVVQFRSGKLDDGALLELISSYESSNYTASSINNFLDTFTATMHKTELLDLFQRHNAMFIDRRTDKYKILANNYEQEIRIISADLSADISSPFVYSIVKLLDIETGKESGAISYYIEDIDLNVPEVNVYLQGKVIKSFPVEKTEYILLNDYNGKVMIIDANSLDLILAYELMEIRYSILAVVDDMLYNIDTENGIITSTAVEDIMAPQNAINWTQVGSFPSESNWIRNSAAVNETLIYFVTYHGVLYVYDTTLKTVTKCENIEPSDNHGSLIVVNNNLYIHTHSHFYSYDGRSVRDITTSETRNHAGLFQFGSNICRVGGNTTDVYPDPVSCYNPDDDTWTVTTHINEARKYPAVVGAGSKTYIFGGASSSSSTNLKSAEVLYHDTKIWSYVPSPITDPGSYPQALIFYV